MRLRLVPLLASGGLLACLFGGLLLIERQVATLNIAPALTEGNLTDAQEKSIDLLVQSSQLLISWTFATLGAAAFIFKYAMDNRLRIGIFDIAAGCLIVVLAICSLYFSQIGFDVLIRNLTLQQYPFDQDAVYFSFRYQFLFGLGAVAVLGLHFFQFVWRISRMRSERGNFAGGDTAC
jgi:hypothetical protein